MTDPPPQLHERSLVRCLPCDGSTGEVLVLARGGNERFGHGLWEILQGSRERGETPREAVLREIEEEIGVDCTDLLASAQLQLLPVSDDHFGIESRHGHQEDWSNYNYILTGESLRHKLGALTPDESHSDYEWVSIAKASEMLSDHPYSSAGQRLLQLVPSLAADFARAATSMDIFS